MSDPPLGSRGIRIFFSAKDRGDRRTLNNARESLLLTETRHRKYDYIVLVAAGR